LVVIRIATYRNRISNRINACFDLQQPIISNVYMVTTSVALQLPPSPYIKSLTSGPTLLSGTSPSLSNDFSSPTETPSIGYLHEYPNSTQIGGDSANDP
jgi:hypothetical protein